MRIGDVEGDNASLGGSSDRSGGKKHRKHGKKSKDTSSRKEKKSGDSSGYLDDLTDNSGSENSDE